jgi:selenocysteine-specific elongation factor
LKADDLPPARSLLVGTAGHVDHGKTALIQALTGIDCDRLAEEKRRGITIDLGFAHLDGHGVELGFVDVPGHERYVHNALAGLGGLDLMLLVVDASEGVRPQTREHAALCDLLGVPAAIVALTKIDLADAETRAAAEQEIGELLAPTRFAAAPVFAVSSRTGEGIAVLRDALLARAADAPTSATRSADAPARLPVDRAFVVKGRGTVVTGTLVRGTIRTGDELEALPGSRPFADGAKLRVREVQVHGATRREARAGERVALQLAGAEVEQLPRGTTLVEPGSLTGSRRLLTRVAWLDPAFARPSWTDVVVFSGTAETPARARVLDAAAGESGGDATRSGRERSGQLVEVITARPLVAARGDRIVLRRPSPAVSVGGGIVLDPHWRRPRRARRREHLEALAATSATAGAAWLLEAGLRGMQPKDLAQRWGSSTAAAAEFLAREAADGRAVALTAGRTTRFLAPANLKLLARRSSQVLDRAANEAGREPGLSRAEFLQRLVPAASSEWAEALLRGLVRLGAVNLEQDRVSPAHGRRPRAGDESQLAEAIATAFEAAGLSPPSPGEIRQALQAKAQILDGVIQALVRRGRLVRLSSGLVLAAQAIDRLEADLRATGWESFSVADFKERFALTRKWAIPLLEHLDGRRVTLRAGERRKLLPPRATPKTEGERTT